MNTIETERLLLRPWKIDDAAEAASLFRYASDPEIGLRCGWPPHTSVEGSMHDIRNILAVENNWAITIKGGAPNSNAPVGSIALKPVSHRTADAVAADPELTKRYGKYLGDSALELGYWIGRPFWGKGYMPEALTAVARLRLRHAAQGRGMGRPLRREHAIRASSGQVRPARRRRVETGLFPAHRPSL